MHYIKTEFMDCSRLNVWRRVEIHDLFMNNIDKFQLVHEIDNYLFSHAGVYLEWTKKYAITLEELFNFKRFLGGRWNTLEDLSRYRGGYNPVGSCIWADLRESSKNELFPGYKQVVGHTQLNDKPYIVDKIACVDVRRCFILDTITSKIENA